MIITHLARSIGSQQLRNVAPKVVTQPFKVARKKIGSANPMWEKIRTLFQDNPERLKVAEFILRNGLSIRDDKIWINEIEVPILKVARVAGVDRRTITETRRTIKADLDLKVVYNNLESAGPLTAGRSQAVGPWRPRNNG